MSAQDTTAVRPPNLIWGLTETGRSTAEYAWFLSTCGWLAHRGIAARGAEGVGTGRPVLVVPGLGAGDQSTAALRHLLRAAGYRAYGWGLGIDVGPTERIITGLDERLADIRRRSDGQAVSVIGQSLGGVLGLELARRNPGGVERLISLGSPVTMSDRGQSRAGGLYDLFASRHLPEYAFERWMQAERPAIPTTSVYSRSDGVVAPAASLYPDEPLTENIRVRGSHVGMGVLPPAVYAVLDRLAVPVDQWRRFEAPAWLRAYFPAPDRAAGDE